MKTISIISFQNAHNYGAVLQAYGLQSVIKQLGFKNVCFINYNPQYLKNRYNPFRKEVLFNALSGNILKGIIKYIYVCIALTSRNINIRKSIKRLLCQTKKEFKIVDDIKHDCEVLICGSDQIWNKALTKGYDEAFWGKGDYPILKRIISYAASTEISAIDESDNTLLSKYLDNLDFISVREQSFKELLSSFYKRQISVCVDPTILCGKKTYSQIAKEPRVSKGLVLVYAYDPNDSLILDTIESIPDISNKEIHFLLLGMPSPKQFISRYYHGCVTVESFLGFFKKADYIITNSFHGLAFSLLFEKNFNVTYFKGKEGRCLSLLNALNLTERSIKEGNEASWGELDYGEINAKIDKLRESSLSYLENALTF